MCWHRPLLIALLALALVQPAGADSGSVKADEEALKAAGVGTDGAGLLEFFRKRTLLEVDADKIKGLIRQLGDDSFQVREQASAELVKYKSLAEPFLKQALKDGDAEIARRAEACLQRIQDPGAWLVDAAAARLLADRKPAGAAEIMLNYLSFAGNDLVTNEVQAALTAIALREGKPDQALINALTDKQPIRRGVAAVALCQAGATEQRAAIRKLLQDKEISVRFRVAQALACAQEKDAVPVLIDLLLHLSDQEVWRAEDLLYRLAGEKAPLVPFAPGDAGRRKSHDSWADWWAKSGGKVQLAKIELPRLHGHTMVVLLDAGKIMEVDANSRPLWQVEGFQFPLDAQLLPGDRVLAAEHGDNRVTERNRKGEVVWDKKLPEGPLVAQRLANGRTFIATSNQLLEVDREGKEVFTYNRPGGDAFRKAQKLRNGDIVFVTTSQRFVRLNPAGKELQNFQVNVQTNGGRIDVLPNGNILIPELYNNKVVEFDPDGKPVWEANLEQPVAAVRLANGNTLVTSLTQNRAVEFDRSGKEVWEYKTDTRLTRAWRR